MIDDKSMRAPGSRVRSPFTLPVDSPPPLVDVEVGFGARSRRGPLRTVNDDHYLILRLAREHETLMTSLPDGAVVKHFDEHGYGMVIADGMGRAGEAASRLAISTLVELAINFGKWNVRVNELIADEMMDRAERFYRSIDATLRQAGSNGPSGLETTVTAAYSAGSELFFAHVGHSRVYLFRDDELLQLTRDHTLDRERPGRAAIVDVNASSQDRRHIVTRTLGGSSPGAPNIDVERCGLAHGDVILLCTNGLTDFVDDAAIANALRTHSTPDDQCGALVDLASGAGCTDDVTVLVGHYRIRARIDDAARRAGPRPVE
jgi:serine/threonine protein phosphatase PrpC